MKQMKTLLTALRRAAKAEEYVTTEVLAEMCGVDVYDVMCLMHRVRLVTEELFFPTKAALKYNLAVEAIRQTTTGHETIALWSPKAQFIVLLEAMKQRAMEALSNESSNIY